MAPLARKRRRLGACSYLDASVSTELTTLFTWAQSSQESDFCLSPAQGDEPQHTVQSLGCALAHQMKKTGVL